MNSCNVFKKFHLVQKNLLKLENPNPTPNPPKHSQMVSSHSRLERSLLTALLATQRYHPVWLRLTSVTLITLVLPCAKVEMLPLRVSCCHTYWIGPVPFSRLQRIHIVDPSTGDTSLIRRYGLLTGTVSKTKSHI